ncbi:hypothetical protein O185_15655 [Photorhabdus temperata J3]|uniref:Uncharacterized protein n=1 Tax=Photorhabdus temperata J3 TaxID=1389415 RepID=U7QW13_PHOTE|nr:hypothetical protein O185_15655 [Photorhabdus temperata J3]
MSVAQFNQRQAINRHNIKAPLSVKKKRRFGYARIYSFKAGGF